MADVISMTPSVSLTSAGVPLAMIEYLEQLLEAVRRGDVRAIGVIQVLGNDVVRTRSFSVGYRHQIVAGATYLQLDAAAP